MNESTIDVLFAVIAQREVVFFSDVADIFKEQYGLNVGFLTFYEPGDAYLEKKGYRVFSLHKNVNLQGITIDEDVVRRIEEKYAITNIRTLLIHEKLTFRRLDEKKLLRKLVAYDEYFERIFLENDIGNVIQELGGFIAPMSLYYNCRHHKVRHIFLEPSLFKGHLFLNVDSTDVNIQEVQDVDSQVMTAVRDYISAYHKNKTVVIPVKDKHHFADAGLTKLINKRNITRLSEKLYNKYIKNEKEEYDAILNHVKRHNVMFWGRRLLNGSYSEFEEGRKYIYFPLHVPLDFQLTVRESRYLDQLALIETISRFLPFDYYLYIKEHPASIGGYGSLRLRKVLRNRNVKLIRSDVNSYDLIKHSVCVITINSKVGAEALMQGKNVLVLGKTYYARSKKSLSLKNIQELENIDFTKMEDNNVVDYDFFHRIYVSSYRGELYVRDKENVNDLAHSLKKLLHANSPR
jgi:hypothetical protein